MLFYPNVKHIILRNEVDLSICKTCEVVHAKRDLQRNEFKKWCNMEKKTLFFFKSPIHLTLLMFRYLHMLRSNYFIVYHFRCSICTFPYQLQSYVLPLIICTCIFKCYMNFWFSHPFYYLPRLHTSQAYCIRKSWIFWL